MHDIVTLSPKPAIEKTCSANYAKKAWPCVECELVLGATLRCSVSTLEAFNHVRNDRSLAHDNPTLSYDESLLIFNHICSAVRFIRALERRDVKVSPITSTDDMLNDEFEL